MLITVTILQLFIGKTNRNNDNNYYYTKSYKTIIFIIERHFKIILINNNFIPKQFIRHKQTIYKSEECQIKTRHPHTLHHIEVCTNDERR